MDVRLQSKLLRAIQERVIDRVGGTRPVPVDIRIIATSNRNLADAVREGTFREDLLFRLNVVNLKIPPLRERPADILELAQHFAKKYADANGVPLRPISAEARRVLTANRWQGNVRELENTMHRAVLMAQGDEIGADAILTPDGDRLDLAKTAPAVAHATFAAEQVTRALVGRTVADVERDLILETLKHCLGNRTHAANILGISIRTLRNKRPPHRADLEAVFDVPVQVSAVLGRSKMDVGELLKLGPGTVLELDRRVGEAIDIYVNNRLVARGEVVLVEDKLGVTMTEIIKAERI